MNTDKNGQFLSRLIVLIGLTTAASAGYLLMSRHGLSLLTLLPTIWPTLVLAASLTALAFLLLCSQSVEVARRQQMQAEHRLRLNAHTTEQRVHEIARQAEILLARRHNLSEQALALDERADQLAFDRADLESQRRQFRARMAIQSRRGIRRGEPPFNPLLEKLRAQL